MALLVNNDVSARVLDWDDAVARMEDAFTQLGRGDAAFQPRTDIWSPDVENGDYYCWGSLLGAIREPPRLAMRFKSDIVRWEYNGENYTQEVHNVRPGTFMGFILLFDTSTGELLGLLNDGVIQHARVGATAGVACDHLANEDAETVGILGSGGMARSYLRAFDVVRDLTEVTVYSPNRDHCEQYAAEMERELGIDVRPVDGPATALDGVDIAATCTDTMEPVYRTEWLEAGQFLINVHPMEMTEETYRAADKVLTTNKEPVLTYFVGGQERLDGEKPVEEFHRGYHEMNYPTIDALLAGDAPGREDPSETVFYHNMSSGIQFAAIGDLVYQAALDRGLGTSVPLSWFQQDIRN
jgi:alanine dehydrogenase